MVLFKACSPQGCVVTVGTTCILHPSRVQSQHPRDPGGGCLGSPTLNNSSRTDPAMHQPHSLQARSPPAEQGPPFLPVGPSPRPGVTTAPAEGHSSPHTPVDPSQGVTALNPPGDFPPHGSQTPSASPPWTPMCPHIPSCLARALEQVPAGKGHGDTVPHVCHPSGHTGPTNHCCPMLNPPG